MRSFALALFLLVCAGILLSSTVHQPSISTVPPPVVAQVSTQKLDIPQTWASWVEPAPAADLAAAPVAPLTEAEPDAPVAQAPASAPFTPEAIPVEQPEAADYTQPLALMEEALPLLVELTAQRLAVYLRGAGESEVDRIFTQEELQEIVVEALQARMPDRIQAFKMGIGKQALTGTGLLVMGKQSVQVSSKVGIRAVRGRPRLEIREVKVGGWGVPPAALSLLQQQVNQVIGKKKYPVRFERIKLEDGALFMSAELA